MIIIKRMYDTDVLEKKYTVLIDRLWPRGIRKSDFNPQAWFKDVAPSTALRKWFNHDPEKWKEFKKRYKSELSKKQDILKELKALEAESGTLILLYAAHDTAHNNAVVLKEVLDSI